MSVYLYVLIFIFFLLALNKLKHQKYYSHIAFLTIFIIAAFRSEEIGNDLINYLKLFQLDLDRGLKSEMEWGFKMLSDTLLQYSNDQYWYIFTTTTLTFIPLYILILKKSNNAIFSLLIFFIISFGFGFFLTGIRQSMAVVICLWAFNFFENKKYIHFVFLVIIASSIHVSALTCFLSLLISIALPVSKKKLLFLLYISILFGFLLQINIFNFITIVNKIPGFTKMANIYILYNDYFIDILPNFNGLLYAIVPNSIFAYFAIKYKSNSFYSRLFLTGVILTNAFASTPSIPRYFLYTVILQIFLIPTFYPLLRKEERLIVNLTISLLIIYFLFISLKVNGIYMYSFSTN